ncbi:MAG: cyclic dehypoxanthinyl futalosine synthase [candidate division WOR-3 bacterium]
MRRRLSPSEGLRLFFEEPLHILGSRAHELRCRLNDPERVTYIVDTNINYTNICSSRCSFCAFWRSHEHPESYTMSLEEYEERLRDAEASGITTVLLQGGLNPDISLNYMLEMVRRARKYRIHLHAFSPPEIGFVAEKEGISTREALLELWSAGLRTIPGGGAEILSERLRNALSPRKLSAQDWIRIMREAHKIGFKTTATMMFGVGEWPEEIVGHLEAIRKLQDETGGFTAFIAWDFKPGNTRLAHLPKASPTLYLRIIALARLYLDNFPHIQASWSSQGKEIGQLALHYGADDLGSLLVEENVMRSAGHRLTATESEIRELIEASGFRPAKRDTLYRLISDPSPDH